MLRLNRLSEIDPRTGQLVEWKVFGGLEIVDVARMQNLTERTVFHDWRRARALFSCMSSGWKLANR